MAPVTPPAALFHVSRSRTVALAAGLLALACDRDRDLPDDQTWESPHFRYHTRQGDTSACEGVLVQLERHFEIMQGYLGLSWPSDKKVNYYKFRDKNDYVRNAPCPEKSASCAETSSVLSPYVLQEHELVHAYLATVGGPPSFFVEGAAVALSCDYPYDELSKPPAWQDVVRLTNNDVDDVYKTGGWFVEHLLDRYGPAPFLAFYGRLNDSASAEQIASTFQETYGETLDSVWNAAIAANRRVGCVSLWPCQGRTLMLDGNPQSLGQACDGSDNSRTFTLDTATDLVMSSSGMPYHAPILCDSTRFVAVTYTYTGTAAYATLAHVNAGHYFIRAVGMDTFGTAPIRALSEKAYVSECAQALPVDLGTGEFTSHRDLDLIIPNDEGPWFIKLHVPSDWHLWSVRTASEHLMVCPDCGNLSQCQPFRGDVPLDSEGNAVLRLTSTPSTPGYMSDTGYSSYTLGYKRRAPTDPDAATDADAPDAE